MKNTVIEHIAKVAKQHNIEKVILFGSQAKHTNNIHSDYDLAVIGKNFIDFFLDLTYNEVLLERFDIHNYNQISNSFREEIDRTGVTVYEKI